MVRYILIVSFILFQSLIVTGQVVTRMVLPGQTDSRITTFNIDSHYVYYNASVLQKNVLVVHLPGSYGAPKRARLYGTLAADLGFHSIGLTYPNAPTVASFCNTSSDSLCYEKVRLEIIEGFDYSPSIAIDSIECMFNRLSKLLQYLNTNYPTENWGQYLDTAGNIVFNKIIFSGHSQGGGHAALIAKHYAIQRALCFSSPKDYSGYFSKPASWLSTGLWQTPPSQIFAFNHTLDGYLEQLEILDSLGLGTFGPPVNVDSITTPYRNTRQLITSYPVPSGDEHGSTIQDYNTPFISGIPVFLPVWNYMLTGSLTTSVPVSAVKQFDGISVFPNPANDIVTISLPSIGYWVGIYTLGGQKIYEGLVHKNSLSISLKELSSGTYIINARNSHSLHTARFVKR